MSSKSKQTITHLEVNLTCNYEYGEDVVIKTTCEEEKSYDYVYNRIYILTLKGENFDISITCNYNKLYLRIGHTVYDNETVQSILEKICQLPNVNKKTHDTNFERSLFASTMRYADTLQELIGRNKLITDTFDF